MPATLLTARSPWPVWDVDVYWWGGPDRPGCAGLVVGVGLATVTLFAAFSGLDPMPWPGRGGVLRPDDPGPAEMDRADDAERSTWPLA